MADDAAAPEGKLSGSDRTPADAPLPDGATESPAPTETDVTESAVAEAENAESDSTAVQDSNGGEALTTDDDAELDEAELAELDDSELASLNPATESMSPVKLALIIGVVVVLALGGAVGWLGFRSVESRKASEQRQVFLQVGRQAALNLTTIDAATVDADVQRILDSAAESFYDDFSARTQPFVDVVKQAQSKSVGEVTSAGLESDSGTDAQVLVAITVRTSNLGAQEQEPRAWRMRIAVKQIGDETKVTNVEFVP